MTNRAYFPASTHLFAMAGPDARDFLHRLTTTHVRELAPGDSRPGFFLNSQGKIRAAFRVSCVAPDSFWIEVDAGKSGVWKDSLLKVVDEFTFAEKYTLTENREWTNVWILGTFDPTWSDPSLVVFREKNVTHLWGPRSTIEKIRADRSIPKLSEEEFERARILALLPRVDHEITPDVNPLEIGLRETVAEQKGCYPGQEVIEKIISLGSPAKRLALVRGTGAKPALGPSDSGSLTSIASDAHDGWVGLAVLRKTAAVIGKKIHFATSELQVERIADEN